MSDELRLQFDRAMLPGLVDRYCRSKSNGIDALLRPVTVSGGVLARGPTWRPFWIGRLTGAVAHVLSGIPMNRYMMRLCWPFAQGRPASLSRCSAACMVWMCQSLPRY
jgi:hypothetical protein